jgi:signal transduction histidine kinase
VPSLTRSAAAAGKPTDDLVEEALGYAQRAAADLRDLVHGILPASLSRGGLRRGIESLIADLPMPVELDFSAPRLPANNEITTVSDVNRVCDVQRATLCHDHVAIVFDFDLI